MRVSPEELRNFAGALHPEDFSGVNAELPARKLPNHDAFFDVNEFLGAWAPETVKVANDLVRCIDAFRWIALTAADRFEATDEDNAAILNDLADRANTAQPSTSQAELNELPEPREETGPLTPPEELTTYVADYAQMQEDSIFGNVDINGYGIPI